MINIKKYKKKIIENTREDIKKNRGRGVFGDAFRTLGNFGKLYYKAVGGK